VSKTILTEEEHFKPVIIATDVVSSLNTIKDAIAEQFVTIKAKVCHLSAIKKINTQQHNVLTKQEGILVDPTGQLKIVLWENQVDSLQEGQTYIFTNIRVKEDYFKERYVNPPKDISDYSATATDDYQDQLHEIEVVPDTLHQVTGNICGITNIQKAMSCSVCGSNVAFKNERFGNCPKCKMMTVRLDVCKNNWIFKIMFVPSSNGTPLRLSVASHEADMLLALSPPNACSDEEIMTAVLTLDTISIIR
jgi:hypothetical protein